MLHVRTRYWKVSRPATVAAWEEGFLAGAATVTHRHLSVKSTRHPDIKSAWRDGFREGQRREQARHAGAQAVTA